MVSLASLVPISGKSSYFSDLPIEWDLLKDHFSVDKDVYYFNTATMGLSPKSVIEKYVKSIRDINSGKRSPNVRNELRKRLGLFINCSAEEIALTANVTEGLNIASWSLPLNSGDEVIITTEEHAGNAVQWMNIAKQKGIKLKVLDLSGTDEEIVTNLKQLIQARTKVISVPHVSCASGRILPVNIISQLARESGIYSLIDGAHGLGMLPLSMADIGCDFYAGCFHKWALGPKGLGFLFINERVLPSVNTVFSGAYSDNGWKLGENEVSFSGIKEADAGRYTYGTRSDAIYEGGIEAISFFEALGMEEVTKHIVQLREFLVEELKSIEHIQFIQRDFSRKGGIISFKIEGTDSKELHLKLRSKGYIVRYIYEADLDCVRVSVHLHNTKAHITKLVEQIKEIINGN